MSKRHHDQKIAAVVERNSEKIVLQKKMPYQAISPSFCIKSQKIG